MSSSEELFARTVEAYRAEGFPHDVIGQWTLPANDVADLVDAVRKRKPQRVLEVGTFVGLSTMLIALAYDGAKIVSIDPNLPLRDEMGSMGSKFGEVDVSRPTQDVARAVARRLGIADRIEFVAGGFASGATFTSRRTNPGLTIPVVGPAVLAQHGTFDFAFIDGLHYADVVQADLALAVRHLAPGGVVLMHDCIGMWGTNVRAGIMRFLADHGEWRFVHRPFGELYRSIGVVFRKGEAPDLEDGLLSAPALPDYAVRLLGPTAASLVESCQPSHVIEVTAGAPLLAASFAGLCETDTVAVGPQWLETLDGRLAALTGAGISPDAILVTTAGALDTVADEAFEAFFALLGRRGIQAAALRTPPGESGAACACSRPAIRWVRAVQAAGGILCAPRPFDLAPSRFLFTGAIDKEPPTSALCQLLLFSPDARRGAFIALEEAQAEAAEQNETLRIHYAAAMRSLFQDVASRVEQQRTLRSELDSAYEGQNDLRAERDAALVAIKQLQAEASRPARKNLFREMLAGVEARAEWKAKYEQARRSEAQLKAELDAARSGQIQLKKERDAAVAARDAAAAERDANRAAQDHFAAERNAALAAQTQLRIERDAALVGLDQLRAERDAGLVGQDQLRAERDAALVGQEQLRAERDAALAGLEQIRAERDAALVGQDQLRAERDAALAGHDQLRAERDAALVAQDQLRAERDAALVARAQLKTDRDSALAAHDRREAEIAGPRKSAQG